MKTLAQMGIYPGKTKFSGIGIKPGRPGYIKIRRTLPNGHRYAVIVMVVAVGKCKTDLALASGQYGSPALGFNNIITGHEVVVKVIAIEGDDPSLESIVIGGYYMMVVRQPRVWPNTLFDFRYPPVDLFNDPSRWGEAGLSVFDGGDCPIMVCDARTLIRIPDGINPIHAVFIETASCPAKARRRAEAMHATLVDGLENVDTQDDPLRGQKVAIILGVAGACGLIEAADCLQAGYTVIGVDRKLPDHHSAKLGIEMGVHYIHDDGKDDELVAKTVRQYGHARFIFDATANPLVVDRWEAAIGPTGVTVEFGIPEGCCAANRLPKAFLSNWDVNRAPLRRTIGNSARMGSINASVRMGDWQRACDLIALMSQRKLQTLDSMVHVVLGLDIPAIQEATQNQDFIKPVVLPNRRQAMTTNGVPLID